MRDWIFTEKVWVCTACRRAVDDDAMPTDMVLDCVCTDANETREQRRYEIAKDLLMAVAGDYDWETDWEKGAVKTCLRAADALLAELEREDGE